MLFYSKNKKTIVLIINKLILSLLSHVSLLFLLAFCRTATLWFISQKMNTDVGI